MYKRNRREDGGKKNERKQTKDTNAVRLIRKIDAAVINEKRGIKHRTCCHENSRQNLSCWNENSIFSETFKTHGYNGLCMRVIFFLTKLKDNENLNNLILRTVHW